MILRGVYKRRMRDHDDARARHYELAHWIAFAHHKPGDMPKFEASDALESSEKSEVFDEVAQEQVRGFFIGLALSSGKS